MKIYALPANYQLGHRFPKGANPQSTSQESIRNRRGKTDDLENGLQTVLSPWNTKAGDSTR